MRRVLAGSLDDPMTRSPDGSIAMREYLERAHAASCLHHLRCGRERTMRKRWTLRAAAPIVCAALMACGGTDGANEDRPAQAGQQPPAQQGESFAPVQLSGCIDTAPGQSGFVLRNVRFEPRQQGNAQADTTSPTNAGITEGSWVRLQGGDQNLEQFAGKRVNITGTIVDDGANTIGTAGTAGQQTPSGERSQAGAAGEHHSDKQKLEMGRIARESMANGTTAEIRVQQVQAASGACDPSIRPESR
jgi:hypothetical protein